MKQINQSLRKEDVANKEIEVSIKLGELAILLSLLARTNADDVRSAIKRSAYLPDSFASRVGMYGEFSVMKLYSDVKSILIENKFI